MLRQPRFFGSIPATIQPREFLYGKHLIRQVYKHNGRAGRAW